MAHSRLCSIPGCGKPAHGRGWCGMHYVRWHSHGDPLKILITPRGEPERFFREIVLAYDGDDCLIWPFGLTSAGYGRLDDKVASRILCEEVNGPPPTPEHEAAHSCGKGHLACVTKGHLSWKTPTENAADKVSHGTILRGEAVGNSKLTDADVREIRALHGHFSLRVIGLMYGVSIEAVNAVQTRRRWAWLD